MKKIIVLGGGMVGSAMALDLAKHHLVTVADLSAETLEALEQKSSNLTTMALDVTNVSALSNAIAPFDLVVCAVPGFLGWSVRR